jgi:hypothetical protein
MIDYRTPSSSMYVELLPIGKTEGYAIVHFNYMDSTKNIMINTGIEFAVIGAFEMDISE